MKSGSYSALVRSTSLSQKTKISTPRGNYTCLLNRGGVQYEPTGTAYSIGELGQRKNMESSHPASRLNFSRNPPLRRCRYCDWMEKRAFHTKGEKTPMKWHIAPPAIARYLIPTESGVYFKSFYLLQEITTWYNKNSYNWEFKLC